jgi:hypothetical protein
VEAGKTMSKLDDILENNGLKKYEGHEGYQFMYIEDTEVGDIKQELKDFMLEVFNEVLLNQAPTSPLKAHDKLKKVVEEL